MTSTLRKRDLRRCCGDGNCLQMQATGRSKLMPWCSRSGCARRFARENHVQRAVLDASHVRVGARYPMGEGAIEIDSIETIGFPDITPELARESGFLGVLDLLKVAEHGRSEKIYLVRFHYVRPRGKRVASSTRASV